MNPGLFRTLIGFSDENADVDRIIVRCGPRTNPLNWRDGVEAVRAWRETEKIGELGKEIRVRVLAPRGDLAEALRRRQHHRGCGSGDRECRGLPVVHPLLASVERLEEGGEQKLGLRCGIARIQWRTSRRSIASVIHRGRHLGGSPGVCRTPAGGTIRASMQW
jgi:hypothetical protein